LRTLARLSRLISVPEFVSGIRQAGSPAAAHELIAEFEQQLPE
jgi:mannitol/fructose-specific phosphotransferase system IIA component (Ntr-type)